MAEKYLLEDEESDFTLKAKRRAVDCKRVAELARSAAEKAMQDNRLDLATKLEQEAESLEKIAKN
jgi:transposase